MRDHRPGRVAGPVVIFRASEPSARHAVPIPFDGIDAPAIEVVPGNHFSMLENPQVEVLTERLRFCLAAVR
jgi:hypothetical protein